MTTTTQSTTYTSQGSKAKFHAEQKFDAKQMRHYVNGKVSVLHCHHYATLFSQLAMDARQFGGVQILLDTSRDVFGGVLKDYYQKNGITDRSERIAIAEQYCSFTGLGCVELKLGDTGGTATMSHSHVDEGWLKKWGQHDQPVNYIGQGFLKAACAAIFDLNPDKVSVEETQSIVRGASTSYFSLNW